MTSLEPEALFEDEAEIHFSFFFVLTETLLSGKLGQALPAELGQPTRCTDGDICWHWGSAARLTISKSMDNVCYDVNWTNKGLTSASDCFDIGNAAWFAGCEEHDQVYLNPQLEMITTLANFYLSSQAFSTETKHSQENNSICPWRHASR